LEELFCIVCVGVAKVGIFYLTTKTFTTFFIFNYLNANDLSIGKVQYTYLIINPLFYKEQWLFEADGKDSIFITRSKNYFNLIAVYYAVFQIDIKRLSLSVFSVLENNDDTQ
ncbi:hypothetical protein MRBLMN1_003141, partial [Chitinophaga ginsengisegetis]|uniref:hypothetical protein n=1 Tax=Chitinophaga ginsengisegetis TaxID=393003 RepID=UPI003430BC1E